jgi:two-component system phosphate regulon sensor histidine kinase PhoR
MPFMPPLSLLLLLSLLVLAAWSWRRERRWRQLTDRLTQVAGLRSAEADKLAARFTGLVEAERTLAREEYLRRLFEALLQEIRQGVVILDDQMRIKFCNRRDRKSVV